MLPFSPLFCLREKGDNKMAVNKQDTLYDVKNRSASMVVYKIPEDGIRREFAPGESKKIKFGELEKLSYQAGGRALMTNFLQITNEKVTDNLNIHTEAEYYMSEDQIKTLILEGSLDAFLDCLDYAPVGVIDLVKKFAVALPMNDIQKREALKNKTGFDVSTAIRNMELEKAEDKENVIEPAKASQTATAGGRRTSTTYKVVNKKAEE
jgi:hypothetical protein